MQMKNFETMSDTTFLPFTVFLCKVDLPQVKQNLKSSIANSAYELSYELPNNLKLKILGN